MIKKILSIFAIVCLSTIIVPSVFAACDPPPCDSGYVCVDNECIPAQTERFQPPGPGVCIRIGSNFTMKLTDANSKKVSVNIKSGAIIASETADYKNCPYLQETDSSIESKCTFTDNGDISNTATCILPKPSEIGMVGMLNTIYTVTGWVFYILMLVAVLMIVYGGFIYISAAGDPAKAAKGKTVLTLSIIGLAIALLAKFIPPLVKFILGV
ncbi:MAG: pilin [Candidatus Pacebacteria bacterium]|nr:pilin [Candidatus Paceibacterota bacterium]